MHSLANQNQGSTQLAKLMTSDGVTIFLIGIHITNTSRTSDDIKVSGVESTQRISVYIKNQANVKKKHICARTI